ncbi:MAG: hypothetical protein PVF96_08035 [Candidatus Bathyarchaeota archaeon]
MVTGAGGPAGINFVMSLRIAPEDMFLVGTEANQYFLHLAATDVKHLVPKAWESNYVEKLNEIIRREDVEFIHGQPDVEVGVISENREKLKAEVFLPSKKAVMICQDKFESARMWRKNGIPVAQVKKLQNEADAEDAFQEWGKPIWIRTRHGAGGRGSTPAHNPETASSWVRFWKSRNVDWKFIVQEHLPGKNFGFHSLWKEGELVTSMARERIEYIYPHLAPSGITGTPSIQRTIHEQDINEIGTQAVLSVDPKFNGIACVDLKENREGIPCVTEINVGRMFTTSFFFSYASKKLRKDYFANIPYLYTRLAYKEKIPDIPEYDVLPEEIYWIRHIDAPARLVREGKIIGKMYQ